MKGPAFFAYADNYLIDTENAVILDVEASRAIRQAEVGATRTMIQRTRDRFGLQMWTAALKLLVMPGATLALCLALGLGALPTAMAVLFMALPTAATSYVMARAMGGDAPLMAAITTSEHALSLLTLPLWLLLVRALHLPGAAS